MDLATVIKRPIVTEKSTRLLEEGKYSFQVANKATKLEIKRAIGKFFGVKVKSVQTVMVRGKRKKMLRTKKKTKGGDWKKALVQLVEGEKLDIFEQESK